MGAHSNQRERTLRLARILYEESDEKSPLPLRELLDRLAQEGITAERKSLYRDLAALNQYGLSVTFRSGPDGGWYLTGRPFSHTELRAVMDAVAAYRWLPEDLRSTLLDKLATLLPAHQQEGLKRPLTACRQTGTPPEHLRNILDRVSAACQSGRALSILPCRRGQETPVKQVISPKGLLWVEEAYHLLGWEHREKRLRLYRLDQMQEAVITGLPAQGPEADPKQWAAAAFGLDPARREQVRLRCRPEAAGAVLDRFGTDTQLTPDGEGFTFTAQVAVGLEFWGWMVAHSDRMTVIAPPWAARLWTERYQPRSSVRPRQETRLRLSKNAVGVL